MTKHTTEIHICDGCDARGKAVTRIMWPESCCDLCDACEARVREESPTLARALKRAKDGAESSCG